ncbi:MAG TPA: NUDIX domain-containing protein [Ktedonobacteraceae bacterium]|nr:NUDIX domain-containing protein [Ktedonobacteraceae bacterium]
MKQRPSWQPGEALRETPVVTCFLMRADGAASHLLLVRRSQRVGSYNARWAGVSGFIEPGVTPDEQAFTEIHEEIGLQREQVRMLRRGTVIEHVDASIGRHWYIHPYLFEALNPDAIQLDWEATEMLWITPQELSNFETVPKLAEAYESAINGEVISNP